MQQGPGPRSFDVSTRVLLESDPEGWLAWVGLPVNGSVSAIDSDVSTVLAEVDKVLRVDAPEPWLAHFELQANRDRRLPFRVLQYHALLLHRHELPVAATVVLLRREADGPELSGRLEQQDPTGVVTIQFAFRVVRLWQRPVEELLRGGLGVLPLAPLAAVDPVDVPAIMRLLDERFRREADATGVKELWATTHFLLGLRYDEGQIRGWVSGMSWLRESLTYQAAVREGLAEGRAEGRVIEARQVILELGNEKLGPPTDTDVRALDAVDDLATLHTLIRRVLTASSWQELLAWERRG